MPCGGIYPIDEYNPENKGDCWVCGESYCDLFCDEWDTPLHYDCLPDFLQSDEGQTVIKHGHSIYAEKLR